MALVALPEPDRAIISRRDAIVEGLRRLVGARAVIADEDGRRAYETDALTAYRRLPLAVVLPASTEEVARTLRYCHEHGIKHRLTKAYHPWTNGQVERMNRTIKEATIKAFHFPDFASLKAHVLAFVMAYNFARHLKALRWRTPFKVSCEAWTKTPEQFTINPHHLIPGPYT